METFYLAEKWVNHNYHNLSQEEKERLALAFIAGMGEMQRQGITLDGTVEGDLRNQEDSPYDIYAVSDSLPLDGELKYGDKVIMQVRKKE